MRNRKSRQRKTYDIQNTVGNDLGVDAELVATLGQGEDDRVSSPEDDDHGGGDVVNLPDIGGLQGSGLSSRYDQVVQCDQEKGTADGVQEPSRFFGGVLQGGEQTHGDHDEVCEHDDDGLDLGQTGQQADVWNEKQSNRSARVD